MKIIERYILTVFFRFFALSIAASLSLYLAVDFSEKLDELLGSNVPWQETAMYFLARTPFMIRQTIIPVTAIAVFLTYATLYRRRELIACQTTGISPRSYIIPLFWAGIILTVVVIVFSDLVERPLSMYADDFWISRVKKVDHTTSPLGHGRSGEIWYATKSAVYHLRYYEPREECFYRVSISVVDDTFSLLRRIDGEKMIWEGRWIVINATVLEIGEEGEVRLTKFPQLPLEMREKPSDLALFRNIPEQLSLLEIIRLIGRMYREGINPRSYLLELNLRLVSAVVTGVSIVFLSSLISHMTLLLFQSEVRTLLLFVSGFVVFFGLFQLGVALASSGIIPMSIGMWGVPLAAVVCGVRLLP